MLKSANFDFEYNYFNGGFFFRGFWFSIAKLNIKAPCRAT